jgi:3-phenylpropionate/trans-cinnamate dioxygenase ferredoxin subunit
VGEFRRVAAIADLREGQALGVEVEGRSIVLFLAGGEPHAADNFCPHAGCPLADFGVIEGDEIECECHGSRFEIKTGANRAPPANTPLQVYLVQVSNGDVLVDLG